MWVKININVSDDIKFSIFLIKDNLNEVIRRNEQKIFVASILWLPILNFLTQFH